MTVSTCCHWKAAGLDEQTELAVKFRVMSIPTLVVMKDGKVVDQVSGARPKRQILELL